MKKPVRIVFNVALVVCAVCASAEAGTLTPREASLVGGVNAVRKAYRLRPLRVDPTLVRAAREHSATLLRRHVFTHGALGSRLDAYGARGPLFGENLAWGTGARARAGAVVRAWLASPGHRANLLRPGFRRIGIGARVGAFAGHGGTTMVTADFAGL